MSDLLIGSRTLRLNEGDDLSTILVQLFAPEKGESGGWSCRYTIAWPDGLRESEGWGHDALQAISLTLTKIGIDIYTSEYHESGQLMWERPGGGYGFPLPKNGRDMLIGDDKLNG